MQKSHQTLVNMIRNIQMEMQFGGLKKLPLIPDKAQPQSLAGHLQQMDRKIMMAGSASTSTVLVCINVHIVSLLKDQGSGFLKSINLHRPCLPRGSVNHAMIVQKI